MKRMAVAAGIIIAVLISAFLLYDNFVADRIMDKGGMENPDFTEDFGDIEILDGDGTYVDDEALFDIIAGTWQSVDCRMTMTLGDDGTIFMEISPKDGESETVEFVKAE